MRRLICLMLLSAVAGCSDANAPPPLYPVTGSLKVGGQPLEGITVQLVPSDPAVKTLPGIGKTDAQGNFTILTNGDKGANSGKYKVVLMSGVAPSNQEISVEEASKMSGMMTQKLQSGESLAPPKSPFPMEWASATTTPKEVEVAKEPVTINIDI